MSSNSLQCVDIESVLVIIKKFKGILFCKYVSGNKSLFIVITVYQKSVKHH